MKKKVRYLEEFPLKIKKCSNDIENLRIDNESAKKQLINMLKVDGRNDFIEKAEYFLELLLHTEKLIEVLRHDLSEFSLAANRNAVAENFELYLEKLYGIEKDVVKTANMVEQVKIAIDHERSQLN